MFNRAHAAMCALIEGRIQVLKAWLLDAYMPSDLTQADINQMVHEGFEAWDKEKNDDR